MSFASPPGAGPPEDWDQGNHGRQPKASLQREYRKREGDVFNELRDIIRELNNQEPATRHDILSEASRLMRQLATENMNLKQQLSGIPPARGNGGNNVGLPGPPSAHAESAYGRQGGPWVASHGFAHNNNTQAPGTSSQIHAPNLMIPPGTMPEIDQLMRVVDEDIRANNIHLYPPYYRK